MATTKVSGNLIQTATVTGNNIATGTITTNNISTSVNLGGPKITSLTYPGDDTAADTAGGQTVVLTGNGFVTGASVLLDGVAVGSATVTNTTSISFTTPVKSTGSYIVYVVNTDGSTAILVPGIQYSGVPTFSTSAGSLGAAYEYAAVSSTIAATGDGSITFSQVSGTLPDGVTLASNGQLSGTTSAQSGNTTFSFTVRATDAQNQDTDRNFSVTINVDAVTWSAPANNATITTYEYAAISNTFAATSAAGRDVVYTANTLPANVTITGSTVSGTPTTVGNTTSLITATSNTTNRTGVQTLNFVVQEDVVTWSSPANNVTYTWAQSVANTANLAATSAAGRAVTFTANSLPTGLAVSGNTITGTPTVAGNSSSLITATAATTNRTAVQTINWVIQLAADAYWKTVSLLVGGSSNTVSNSFIQDSSLNNAQLVINGDAIPSKYTPYNNGYYSNYFDGSGDYVTGTLASAIGTSDFTVEFWINPPVVSSTTGIFDTSTEADYTGGVGLGMGSSQQLRYVVGGGTGDFSNSTITANKWTHVALVRTGGNGYLYINGTLATSVGMSGNFTNTGFCLGRWAFWTTSYQFTGYLSNFRLVKSAVYTANFTPSTAPLTSIANTSVLTCQSSRFVDTSPNAIALTNFGNVSIFPANPLTTANSSYDSYGSAYFDGTGDFIKADASAAFTFGTGNFSIEMWVYLLPGADAYASFYTQNSDVHAGPIMGTDIIGLYTANGGTGAAVAPTIPTNRWTHIAMTRAGTTVKVFLNGVQIGTFESSLNITSNQAVIGARYTGGSYNWKGYISDVRVVKGTAIYTSAFTPPTAPLTPVANTQLLTCQYNGGATNNGFIDQSNYSNIVTRTGNATQGTFSPFSNAGWSTYFPGSTANYVSTPSSTDFSFGAGDYTIEAWCYSNSLGYGSAGCVWHFALPEVNAILRHNGSIWQCYYGYGGASFTNVDTSVAGINQWVHHAIVRQGTTVKWYINGVERGSGTDAYGYSGAGAVNLGNYAGYGYEGYISNFRFVKGTAVYTSAFTPPTAPLAAIANTKGLLFQSNRLIDNGPSNHALTVTGSATVQAFSPVSGVTSVPTSYSNYFDGTGDYLTTTVSALGTDDYTVEMYVWADSNVSSDAGIFSLSDPTEYISYHMFAARNGSSLYVYNGGLQTSGTMNVNTWNHIALTRSGTSFRVFLNGTQVGSTITSSLNITKTGLLIGGYYTVSGYLWKGYISGFRMIKGTALYTADFTPPTTPVTAVSGTTKLTCHASTMVDGSTNGATITVIGNTTPRPFNPFGITASPGAYSPSVNGGSMYFDGTGDKLTIANYPQLALKANDFTIQSWFYTNVASTEQVIMTNGWASYAPWLIRINNSNQVLLNMSLNGGSWYVSEAVFGTVTPGQWYHIAVTRTSGVLRAFLNGVQGYTTDLTTSSLYDGSQALTIGGRSDTSVPLNGYITDAQIINGTSLYKANFFPPAVPTTATINTTLLLNGTSGGIIDAHGTTNLETVGDVKLAPEDPYAGSYYSNYFNNASAEASLVSSGSQISLGAGDFTIECWVNQTGSADGRAVFIVGTSAMALGFYQYGTSLAIAGYNPAGSNLFGSTNTGPAVSLGTWDHHAIVRNSGTITWYKNGVSVYTVANATNFTQTGVSIGYWNATGGWIGYISNLRIVAGTAVYTSAFTPPTAPLTAISGTRLLTCQSNKFIDNSTNAYALTVTGTPQVKSTNPFQKNSGTSMYFDGTGDYLQVPYSPSGNLEGDFTIEMWVNITTIKSQTRLLCIGRSNSGGNGLYIYYSSSATKIRAQFNASTTVQGVTALTARVWNHIAVTRSGSTVRIFLNGSLEASGTYSSTLLGDSATGTLVGGENSAGSITADYDGYIKDLRITKGYARYTTSFTPPTEPLIVK